MRSMLTFISAARATFRKFPLVVPSNDSSFGRKSSSCSREFHYLRLNASQSNFSQMLTLYFIYVFCKFENRHVANIYFLTTRQHLINVNRTLCFFYKGAEQERKKKLVYSDIIVETNIIINNFSEACRASAIPSRLLIITFPKLI